MGPRPGRNTETETPISYLPRTVTADADFRIGVDSCVSADYRFNVVAVGNLF